MMGKGPIAGALLLAAVAVAAMAPETLADGAAAAAAETIKSAAGAAAETATAAAKAAATAAAETAHAGAAWQAATQMVAKVAGGSPMGQQLVSCMAKVDGEEIEYYVAYLALIIMAVLPIYFGSKASAQKLQARFDRELAKEPAESDEEDDSEYFSLEDVKLFPLVASAMLLTLYLLIKYLSPEYLNYLITAYFSVLGVGALTKTMLAVVRGVTGWRLVGEYRLELFRHGSEVLSTHFSHVHVVLVAVSTLLAVLYAMTKHWIISNLYGMSFATAAVQLLVLDSFSTGMLMLAGLFVYDIFWVFGTDVMVTVARSFNAPIKVMWPKDLLSRVLQDGVVETLFAGKPLHFSMLGLGDIVIPGIFIALCLRFDHYLRHQKRLAASGKRRAAPVGLCKWYFGVNMTAYVLGLIVTTVVMHVFKAAQPALLYLSPACILAALLVALVRGQLSEVFSYREGEKAGSSAESSAEPSADASTTKRGGAKSSAAASKRKSKSKAASEEPVAEQPAKSKAASGGSVRSRKARAAAP